MNGRLRVLCRKYFSLTVLNLTFFWIIFINPFRTLQITPRLKKQKPLFLFKELTCLLVPGYPGRQGTTIYLVTVETSRLGQARYTHLRSSRGNQKNVCVCILYFRSSARS
jgi:hypothetical protein